ncbi:MAG: tetraacyldisaccharide 4'-kinase [Gammaproteobacteria bacterium]|nr:MAG: tetraacyldisaccharide 4'-kinase [Gammaproteobacteria bacterium]
MPWWTSRGLIARIFLPLSLLFALVVLTRRLAYRRGWIKSIPMPCPVIVVGNILVGGAGKTPFIITLARELIQQGYCPLILTRGYRGRSQTWPLLVDSDQDAAIAGDEAVLLARRAGCPVIAGPDRVEAAHFGFESFRQEPRRVLLLDDGLQHYRIQRDIEIAIEDGDRGYGNGWLLPAGPLREPLGRLQEVDFRIVNGKSSDADMVLQGDILVNLADSRRESISNWRGRKVHALAGIGHPERFFRQLEQSGLEVIRHPYPDHFGFREEHILFDDPLPVVMTEKDAVKCEKFASKRHWVLPVEANVEHRCIQAISHRLEAVMQEKQGEQDG